ncbi:MAG TPA: hypothetical protein PLL33_09325 [Paracoccus sp. (in: a-proteobacteria)]|nr:hypothetical protein [Paracoccus sp. (in: a-proteobacteria)]
MSRLFLFLLSVSVFSLAGTGVIIVLVLGYYSWPAILAAGLIGAVGGVPIAWLIAKRIRATDPRESLRNEP